MANPKSKVLPRIFNVYLFVLAAHCVDVAYPPLRGEQTIFGTNLYGHVIAVICVFVACMIQRKDVKPYGVVLNPKRIFKGFYRGAIFSLVPIAIVAALFSLIYAAFGVEWAKVSFVPPSLSNSGDAGLLKATVIYAVAIAVTVFMKEFFFRGYALRSARPTYPFSDANIVQAALCIPIALANHSMNVIFDIRHNIPVSIPFVIVVALFYIVHEFLTGIKWGLLARVSKDIWLVFFDHYIYNFLAFSLFFSQSRITNWQTMVKLMLVQIISFIMVWIYYKKKRSEAEMRKLERELSAIESRQKRERGEEHYDGAAEHNEKNAKANSSKLEDYSEGLARERTDAFSSANLLRHHAVSSVPEDYKDESLLDLRDIDVNDFYREYAKEVERRTQRSHKNVTKKLKNTDSSVDSED